MATVRAHYIDGVLQPLEPLPIEEGCEVEIVVEAAGVADSESTQDRFSALAGAWQGVIEDPEALKQDIREAKHRPVSRRPKR